MPVVRLIAEFPSAAAWLAAYATEVVQGGLVVRGAALPPGTPPSDCTLVVRVAGEPPVELPARLASVAAGLGVLVIFPAAPAALHALADRLRRAHSAPAAPASDEPDALALALALAEPGAAPPAEAHRGAALVLEPQEAAAAEGPGGTTAAEALTDAAVSGGPEGAAAAQPEGAAAAEGREDAAARARPGPAPLTLQEKMQLAMTGDRDARFQLLRDPNKALHPMVLKNPRLTLEEVGWAARNSTLNPEALKLIAEHPEWGQNASVAAALVRNPKTPMPVALKLLPRLAVVELRAIAKSQGRPQIVQAAKKLLAR